MPHNSGTNIITSNTRPAKAAFVCSHILQPACTPVALPFAFVLLAVVILASTGSKLG